MRQPISVLLSLCAMATAGCIQVLDTNAASGSPALPPAEGDSDAGLSTVILPGPPPFGFYDNSGNIVTSEDPCDATRAQSMWILQTYCGDCHGGRTPGERAGTPPFDFVLNVTKLTTTFTSNTTPPMLFVSPGDPDHSRVYLRARRGEMPPPAQSGLPRPTVSDLSVLREWIANCLGAKAPRPAGTGGSNGGGSAGASGAGSDNDGGKAGAGGSGGWDGAAGGGGARPDGGNSR